METSFPRSEVNLILKLLRQPCRWTKNESNCNKNRFLRLNVRCCFLCQNGHDPTDGDRDVTTTKIEEMSMQVEKLISYTNRCTLQFELSIGTQLCLYLSAKVQHFMRHFIQRHWTVWKMYTTSVQTKSNMNAMRMQLSNLQRDFVLNEKSLAFHDDGFA